ncbi:tetratricopeptide repeat protein [Mitsuaria sp. 7]|uniref:tetratricopeptide repeat protein n=1 Tax=Mitsuaria sp. 7 TaxID=1658665 RepID=UPI00083372F3|nr:tetratricopeptide repeat protein [Mitsuaria sp. 7]
MKAPRKNDDTARRGTWRRLIGAICVVTGFSMLMSVAFATPAQAAVLKDAALQALLDAGRADDLEKLAGERLKAEPDEPQAVAALALAQLDLADGAALKQNTQRLEQCVQRTPNEGACHYALALALVMQARGGSKLKALGSLGRVSELAQRAMALLPDAPEPRSALQQYYLALPSFIGGGESKARALESDVKDPAQLSLMRARVAASRKDWPAMEKALRAVRTQRPELLLELRVLWSDYGRNLMFSEQKERAVPWFEELLKSQPNQAMGAYGLGRAYDALGQYDKAVASFERARGMTGAEQLGLDRRLGSALAGKGDKAGARVALERCVDSRRGSPSDIEDCRKQLTALGAP